MVQQKLGSGNKGIQIPGDDHSMVVHRAGAGKESVNHSLDKAADGHDILGSHVFKYTEQEYVCAYTRVHLFGQDTLGSHAYKYTAAVIGAVNGPRARESSRSSSILVGRAIPRRSAIIRCAEMICHRL